MSSVKTHSMSGSLRLTSQLGVHRTLSSLVLVIGQSVPPPALLFARVDVVVRDVADEVGVHWSPSGS